MCGAATSSAEKQALVDFYTATDGPNWRYKTNWLTGDPCINLWYGIMCNKYGQVISIHIFENRLTGTIPDSISNLVYLQTFDIFNDQRMYEGVVKINRNTISAWNPKLNELHFLEELNFVYLDMSGTLDSTFCNLARLRVINLTNNKMSGALPN
mmetsp:Transcript_25981/g.29995  ORF Transcript_25981/g.29995 Transcript_25981/m.29995 type:complete len:154 (+) Transcript_25981:927-1388(+)